jgi:Flp pilus assembly pilin Flp
MMSVLHHFPSVLRRFAEDTRGASAIEYALLVSVISIAIFAALTSTGEKVFSFYSQISDGVAPN